MTVQPPAPTRTESGRSETTRPAVRLVSSMATRELLAGLADRFNQRAADQRHGLHLEVEAAGGVDVARRVRAGEAFDIVVLAADAISALCSDGLLQPATCTAVADSAMGIACRQGHHAAPIDSVAALSATLRAATSIGYSTGPSGNHLLRILKTLGLEADVSPKLRQAPAGVPVGRFIASGEVEFGFQQISELTGIAGVALLGPLPDAVQLLTTFTAAATTSTQCEPQALADLLAFLRDPAHDELKLRLGLSAAA